MSFTDEQQSIIQCSARLIKANAFAGTGKSTTLRGFAAARPSERALFIAFNKSIQLDAEATFPGNVKCRTSHGLAFPRFGSQYAGDRKLQGDLKPFHLTEVTGDLTGSLPQAVARVFDQRVIETVKAYLVSADEMLSEKHVVLGDSPAEKKHLSSVTVLAGAARTWAKMQRVESSVPQLHDGYFKLWALSHPRLAYDLILADEFQDTNPALQAILAEQNCRIVFTGDSSQSCYRFRGAYNSMQSLRTDATFYLTGSFRFGPDVAEVANRILALKGEKVKLRGLGAPTRVTPGPFDSPQGLAYISRTNAAIFDKAYKAVSAGIPVAFVGGLAAYRMETGEDISRLMQHGPSNVRNPFIASFSSFEELAEYADAVKDRELTGWAKVVERYGGRRFDYALGQIRSNALLYEAADHTQRQALVVVTAHRSKGLEFDRVELAENFVDTLDEETGLLRDFTSASPEDVEELNLLYIAATRSRKELATNQSIGQLFDPALAKSMRPEIEAAAAPAV